MNSNKINFRTPRTTAGTAMEIAVGILVLTMWVLIIYLSVNATFDTIRSLVILGIYSTILSPLMLVLCYYPKLFNIPKRNPRAEHYLLTIQMVRIVSIFVMFIMMASAWSIGRPADAKIAEGIQTMFGCAMTASIAYYLFRLLRIR